MPCVLLIPDSLPTCTAPGDPNESNRSAAVLPESKLALDGAGLTWLGLAQTSTIW